MQSPDRGTLTLRVIETFKGGCGERVSARRFGLRVRAESHGSLDDN
jgi:hypothetical protein